MKTFRVLNFTNSIADLPWILKDFFGIKASNVEIKILNLILKKNR